MDWYLPYSNYPFVQWMMLFQSSMISIDSIHSSQIHSHTSNYHFQFQSIVYFYNLLNWKLKCLENYMHYHSSRVKLFSEKYSGFENNLWWEYIIESILWAIDVHLYFNSIINITRNRNEFSIIEWKWQIDIIHIRYIWYFNIQWNQLWKWTDR